MGSFLVALAAVSRQELVGLALGAVGAGQRRAAGGAVGGGQSSSMEVVYFVCASFVEVVLRRSRQMRRYSSGPL